MLAGKFAGRAAEGDAWIGSSGDYYVPSGEALLHGISLEGVSAAMPGYSVPNALLSHAGAGTRLLVHALSLLAGAALVFALGLLLHGAVCGGAAALLYAWVLPSHLSSDRWLYTLLVLAAAVALVARARAPTLWRSLVLGLCLGMSLLTLSPLFLFPPALALYERLRPPQGWARQSAVIALAAFLPLTLWAAMNWRTQHRLVLFEDGRADNNITIGALGFVSTALGPAVVAEGVADGRRLLPWAAGEALRHPLRTLRACALRLAYGASSQPL
ncbi:MAG: hypothetical protein HY926_13250, partial [Elusimicrobia bacterium]|nr:hypothetical protein [Elusimicrobiota bacterium]